MKTRKTPSMLEKKILLTNYVLYAKRKIANAEGLLAILNGEKLEENISFQEEPFFGCLISLKGKRLKMALHHLVQNGYLRQSYRNNDYYFINTDLGDEIAEKVHLLAKKAREAKKKAPGIIER